MVAQGKLVVLYPLGHQQLPSHTMHRRAVRSSPFEAGVLGTTESLQGCHRAKSCGASRRQRTGAVAGISMCLALVHHPQRHCITLGTSLLSWPSPHQVPYWRFYCIGHLGVLFASRISTDPPGHSKRNVRRRLVRRDRGGGAPLHGPVAGGRPRAPKVRRQWASRQQILMPWQPSRSSWPLQHTA